MKVTALKNGFFGRYISEGEKFDVPAGTKGTWFTPAKTVQPAPTSTQQQALQQAATALTAAEQSVAAAAAGSADTTSSTDLV